VRSFVRNHPDVHLKLQVCVWFEQAARMVEQGQADLGVIFYDRDEPRSQHLDYQRLLDLRFALLTRRDHPLARKKRIMPQDVAAHPLIVPPAGSFARRTFEEFLSRHELGGQVRIVMETALLEIIKKYVAAGVGVGLVHVAEEVEPAPSIRVHYLDARRESISIGAVVRKGAHQSELAQEFLGLLRRHLGQGRGGEAQ
jgi:DNA-binding transcriptional LysR family regulator